MRVNARFLIIILSSTWFPSWSDFQNCSWDISPSPPEKDFHGHTVPARYGFTWRRLIFIDAARSTMELRRGNAQSWPKKIVIIFFELAPGQ